MGALCVLVGAATWSFLLLPIPPRTFQGTAPNSIWIRHSGLQDFTKGQFGDSGRNLYVSAAGKLQTIHRWDLNRDGFPDIVFTQDSNYRTESADALISWGSADGFVSLFPPMWEQRPRSSLFENILNGLRKELVAIPGLACQSFFRE
jgi:hypothetical protein